jgi:hypothetical protein
MIEKTSKKNEGLNYVQRDEASRPRSVGSTYLLPTGDDDGRFTTPLRELFAGAGRIDSVRSYWLIRGMLLGQSTAEDFRREGIPDPDPTSFPFSGSVKASAK